VFGRVTCCYTSFHVVTPWSLYMLLHHFPDYFSMFTIFPTYMLFHHFPRQFGRFTCYMLLHLIPPVRPKIHADTPTVVIPFRYFTYRFTHFSHFCYFSMLKHCCFVISAAIFSTLSVRKCPLHHYLTPHPQISSWSTKERTPPMLHLSYHHFSRSRAISHHYSYSTQIKWRLDSAVTPTDRFVR
jgi:hypothetical protein